jgi:hypothetical protein
VKGTEESLHLGQYQSGPSFGGSDVGKGGSFAEGLICRIRDEGEQVKHIVTGGCLLAVAAVLVAVPGVAAADDPLQGMTYEKASAALAKDTNSKVIVSTVVGSRLQLNDCLVAHWKKAVMKDGTGKYAGSLYLLDLNCNGALAAAGTPGNSLASSVGKSEKERQSTVEALNANPAYCDTSPQIHENCVKLCNELEPGKCTFQIE